ncbi:hypothetical protein pVa21_079 [Vibrio phage pVa-21]|nr:hypothetical protein pVa21_079 [Vibrio phage pVa-21]
MNPAINEASKRIELPEDFKQSLASMSHIRVIGRGNSGRSLLAHAIANWLIAGHNFVNNVFIEDTMGKEAYAMFNESDKYDFVLFDSCMLRNFDYNKTKRSVCCETLSVGVNTVNWPATVAEFETLLAVKLVPGSVFVFNDHHNSEIHVWYRGCEQGRSHFTFKNPFVA